MLFLDSLKEKVNLDNQRDVLYFIKDESEFFSFFNLIDVSLDGNYIYGEFLNWTNLYTKKNPIAVLNYFSSKNSLISLIKNFIIFCFSGKIKLDSQKTLDSFRNHDKLSDNAIKKELLTMQSKKSWNILGCGLGDGVYEKAISNYLIKNDMAEEINIYGLDPYSEKKGHIKYLSIEAIKNSSIRFDLVIARWVLHHVSYESRWQELVDVINQCNSSAKVCAIEHGVLDDKRYSPFEIKLYYFLNSFFDVIANIALRPEYFTNSSIIGDYFFIHYLCLKDFSLIQKTILPNVKETVYNVGPCFPNQTIVSWDILY